jgi:diguanylate cyclase (GGDEF)-like protein/PAS domain S-box-containing protein
MIHYFLNLPIRYKILLSVMLIIIIITTGGGFFLEKMVRKTIEAQISSELDNISQSIQDTVKTTALASIKNRLRGIAEKNLDIISFFYNQQTSGQLSENEAKLQAAKILLAQSIGKTGYIYCINSAGILQVHPENKLMGKNISNFPFIQQQMIQKKGYLEYEWKNPSDLQERSKALFMVYFEPWDWIISVSSYRGEFKDLINVSDFRSSVLNHRFGTTGYSYIIDFKGNLIIHPKLEGTNIYDSKDANGRMFIKELCEKKNGRIIYPWKNPGESIAREKLVIFNDIPEYGWIIASSSYLEEFYQPVRSIRTIIILTIVIILLAVLPLTFWVCSLITNPLQKLMVKLDLGAKGDLSVRMEVENNDEIGKLASYFNQFMDKRQQDHLELENRVLTRTRELEDEMTERLRVENMLRKHMKLLDTFQNTIPTPVFYINSSGHFLGCNITFAQQIMGIDQKMVIGKTFAELENVTSSELIRSLQEQDRELIQSGGNQVYEKKVKCSDGIIRDFQFSKATFSDKNGQVAGLAGIMMDLTEVNHARQKIQEQADKIKKTNKKLAELASLDGLTGINNRRTFQEQLDQHIRLSNRNGSLLSLLMIDVDHFKSYNDTYGHIAGDEVLRKIATLLVKNARSTDVVARYGGEEFAIILPETSKDEAMFMAEKFKKKFTATTWPNRPITASFGVASKSFKISKDSLVEQLLSQFIDQADSALYHSKEIGRNSLTHIDDIN